MGALARAVASEAKSAQSVYERWLQLLDFGAKSKAGPSVNLTTAFRVSAAFACMREISQGLAQVPFKVMQDYEAGGLARKRVATTHPAHVLLTTRPNDWQTAFELIETIGLHASLGNAYVFKGLYRGKVAELIPLNPGQVKAEQRPDWTRVYKVYAKNGEFREISPDQIWHIRGPSWDGFLGLDMLNIARDALGLSIALEDSAASLHANGVRPSGTYSVEGKLNPQQYADLTNWIKREASGVNSGMPLILDNNAKWLSTTMTSVDAQHREMRSLQIEEVCRFFGVLPSIVGYTGDKANTYASAEVIETAHKARTLGRWYKRLQDSANVNLLTDADRAAGYYTKFVTNALMAASAQARGEFYGKALGSGGSPAFMTQDEIRALEDLDPMGGAAAVLPPTTSKPASSGNSNP